MSAADDMARRCRQHLLFSLSQTITLTKDSKSPWEYLLNRMAGVLGAVVETNYGSPTHSRIYDLYGAIAEVQTMLTDTSSSNAFLHFARAFAVVLEESVRQKEEHASCEECATTQSTASTVSTYHRSASAAASSCDLSLMPVQQLQLPGLLKSGGGVPQRPPVVWRTDPPKKDYSLEAIRGAIIVHDIPKNTSKPEVIEFLEQVGPLSLITYPVRSMQRALPTAICKYESEESAVRAKRELSYSRLGEGVVIVLRADYWWRYDPERTELRRGGVPTGRGGASAGSDGTPSGVGLSTGMGGDSARSDAISIELGDECIGWGGVSTGNDEISSGVGGVCARRGGATARRYSPPLPLSPDLDDERAPIREQIAVHLDDDEIGRDEEEGHEDLKENKMDDEAGVPESANAGISKNAEEEEEIYYHDSDVD